MKDSKEKLQALDALAKRLSSGDNDISDLLPSEGTPLQRMTQARNMSEEALARQVLMNTGVPIPAQGSSRSKVEDFFQRIIAETHPEIKPQVKIDDNPLVRGASVDGYYSPKMDQIGLNSSTVKRSPTEAVATLLHEAGHGYDEKFLKKPGSDAFDMEAVRERLKIRPDESADELYELAGKRHHARIPNLREGTFGLGALKSYLKSGKFRAIGPVTAAAGALAAGSASDALADAVVPGGVESAGAGSDVVQDDTGAVEALANNATDMELRRKALQELRNRSR